MSNAQGIGAPKGGRVHWFLLYFQHSHKFIQIRNHLQIRYYYPEHNYTVLLAAHRNPTAIATVCRTSRATWRLTYTTYPTGRSFYIKFTASQYLAEYLTARLWRDFVDYIVTDNRAPP